MHQRTDSKKESGIQRGKIEREIPTFLYTFAEVGEVIHRCNIVCVGFYLNIGIDIQQRLFCSIRFGHTGLLWAKEQPIGDSCCINH